MRREKWMTWTRGGILSCKAFALQQAVSANSTTKHIVPNVEPWPRLFTLPLPACLPCQSATKDLVTSSCSVTTVPRA